MGKRSIWCKAMEMLGSDKRLLTMPLEARGLYMMLAQRLADGDEPGVLRLTGFFGINAEISMLCSISETDAETFLETLVQRGLVTLSGENVLQLPAITTPRKRQGIGGRPRKGETEAEYQARQREMRLLRSMPTGAAAKLAETPAETPVELDAAPVQLAALEEEDLEKAKLAPTLRKLGEELAECAKLGPARGWKDAAVLKKWLALPGATPARLLAVVHGVVARRTYKTPEHLGYFDPMMLEAAATWNAGDRSAA